MGTYLERAHICSQMPLYDFDLVKHLESERRRRRLLAGQKGGGQSS